MSTKVKSAMDHRWFTVAFQDKFSFQCYKSPSKTKSMKSTDSFLGKDQILFGKISLIETDFKFRRTTISLPRSLLAQTTLVSLSDKTQQENISFLSSLCQTPTFHLQRQIKSLLHRSGTNIRQLHTDQLKWEGATISAIDHQFLSPLR